MFCNIYDGEHGQMLIMKDFDYAESNEGEPPYLVVLMASRREMVRVFYRFDTIKERDAFFATVTEEEDVSQELYENLYLMSEVNEISETMIN